MTNEARPVSAFDFGALGSLKAQAVNDPGKNDAAKKAAQQFEAIFLQMMLKSMRDASPKGGLF
jgi:flagellar protein FlgJ